MENQVQNTRAIFYRVFCLLVWLTTATLLARYRTLASHCRQVAHQL